MNSIPLDLAPFFIAHYHTSHLCLSKCHITNVNICFMCKLQQVNGKAYKFIHPPKNQVSTKYQINYIIFCVILFQQELQPVEFITKRMEKKQMCSVMH